MESGTYKLSASLKGHEDDVRDVAFFAPDSIVSVSRDATVRLWSRNATDRSKFDDHVNSTGTAFVNSVAHIEPTPEHPKGLIVSAGQDTMIDIREPGSTNPDPNYLLIGHAHNVCTLDTFGDLIVSGSWDGTARVWKNFQELYTLRGHESAVWAVLALSESLIVTAGADKTIRLWENGKGIRRIVAHTDCVRGLCRLPNGMFASCANDATIRVWDAEGNQVQELYGHTNYIYSVSALPTGEIVSCGEDRTLRVWKDGNCIQTITHPALSVWSVGVDPTTGDLVTGASDNVVRVFSRDPKKWATEEALKQFEDSVAKSSIPATQVGDIEKDKLPGLEALASPGKKDGQVIMVRNGSNVEAHMWSASAGEWANVGQVVDAVGSNRRRMYEGAEYDFVFDVDIQEGAPPLKLPYNLSQNPFEAARKFLENNELPMDYLDTVGNFIVQNSKGVSLDQTTQQPAGPVADPFGIESRYRPGEANPPSPPPAAPPKVIPQKDYLTISTANLATVEKKTLEINASLVQAGKNDIAFSESELLTLSKLCKYLSQSNSPTPLGDECVQFLQKFAVAWLPKDRLPILDLLRLAAGVSPKVAQMDLLKLFVTSESWSKEFPNNIMLAVRAFVNLFQTKEGCKYMSDRYEEILSAVRSATSGTSNRNLKVAEATLLLNYSVLFAAEKSGDKAMSLLEQIVSVANTEIDAETMYRNLVTLGTLLTLGGEIKQAAALYEMRAALKSAVSRVKDPRFPRLVAEIEKLL